MTWSPTATADQDLHAARYQGVTPYFHDGRLLTLEDTIEFFNLVLGLKLTQSEKADLLVFLLVL
jgi:hypothetical protein